MQRTGLDQCEVGDQRPELRNVLHPPHQVGISGVVFTDDGRARVHAVAHQHIDLVAVKALARDHRQAREIGRFFVAAKVVRVFDHVLLHQIQVRQHLGQTRKPGAQFVQHMDHHSARGLAVELLELFAALLHPLRNVAQYLF